MSILKRASFWVTLVMLGIVLIFVVQSFSFSPKARMFPLIVGIPGVILGVMIAAAEKWPGLIKKFEVNVGMDVKVIQDGVEAEAKIEETAPELTSNQKMRRILVCGAWMAGYAVTVLFVGFHISNFLLSALYVRVHARVSWLKSIIMAVILTGLIYLMFDYFMKVGLFQGILFGGYLPDF